MLSRIERAAGNRVLRSRPGSARQAWRAVYRFTRAARRAWAGVVDLFILDDGPLDGGDLP